MLHWNITAASLVMSSLETMSCMFLQWLTAGRQIGQNSVIKQNAFSFLFFFFQKYGDSSLIFSGSSWVCMKTATDMLKLRHYLITSSPIQGDWYRVLHLTNEGIWDSWKVLHNFFPFQFFFLGSPYQCLLWALALLYPKMDRKTPVT